MNKEQRLPPFARMILQRQAERDRIKSRESSFLSQDSELKTKEFSKASTLRENKTQQSMRASNPNNSVISDSQYSDLTISAIGEETEQYYEYQSQIQKLQKENRELKNQNRILQNKIKDLQDSNEVESLLEQVSELRNQLENERAQRNLAEENILYMKRELELKSKNVKANLKIIESLQIKNMKLQESIAEMRGEPLEESSYLQAIEKNDTNSSFGSGSTRSSMSSRKSRRSLQGLSPADLTDSELDSEIEKLTKSYYEIKAELDDANLDEGSNLYNQLENEFQVISKRLSALRIEQKMRKGN